MSGLASRSYVPMSKHHSREAVMKSLNRRRRSCTQHPAVDRGRNLAPHRYPTFGSRPQRGDDPMADAGTLHDAFIDELREQDVSAKSGS